MSERQTFQRMLIILGIYGAAAMTAGLVISQRRLPYAAGLILGLVMAGLWAWDIYLTSDRAVDMEPHQAELHMKKHSVLHSVAMIAGTCLAAWISFPAGLGMIIGLLGLKAAAYAQLIWYRRNNNEQKQERRE